jgi:hypothetical protein
MADDLNENLENANKGINNLKDELKDALALQKQMEKSVGSYLSVIEKIGEAKRSIAKTEKQIAKEERRLAKQRSNLTDDQIAASKKLIAQLRQQNKEAKEQVETLSKAAAEASKIKAIARSTAGFVYKWGFQNLRGWGVFEMDKEIRNATRSMALGGKGFYNLSKNLGSAADSTTMMGVNIKSLAKMQQGYSEAIGRSVMLTEAGNQAMAELAEGTGLGEGFAVEMASAMDNFGASVETSRDLVEETMNIAAEMGINGAAATKALQSALQKSQRFVFKGGVKALSRMANAATKLKLDMDGIAGVAENVFRPEGAIELAAKLNTIGGEFAKLGNPMKLMFKARNDFEGFAKDIGRASKEFVQFNQESGTFELKGGLAADRMREIANMTGISVEKLREMAVQQAKIDKIGSLVPISFGKKEQDFISSIAQFEEGKGFTISGIEGIEDGKLVSELSSSDRKNVIEEMKNRKLTLEKRAKLNKTFAETLENFMDTLKQLFIPFAQGLQEALGGPLIDFTKKAKEEGWFDSIRELGYGLVDFAKKAGAFFKGMIDTFGAGGTLTALLVGGGAVWAFGAGASLGAGFLSVVGASGLFSKLLGGLGGAGASASLPTAGGVLATGAGALGVAALGGYGGYNLGKTLSKGFGNEDTKTGDAGAVIGGLGAAALGASIGTALLPGIGTIIGAGIGGLAGAFGGKAGGDAISTSIFGMDDGIVKFNPKDKFIGIGNDTLVAGTDAGGNRALANQISGNNMPGKTEVIHKHEDMKITFEFVGLSESTARDLLNNSRFIKDMNSRLNEVSSSVFSGGKLSPNPKFSN